MVAQEALSQSFDPRTEALRQRLRDELTRNTERLSLWQEAQSAGNDGWDQAVAFSVSYLALARIINLARPAGSYLEFNAGGKPVPMNTFVPDQSTILSRYGRLPAPELKPYRGLRLEHLMIIRKLPGSVIRICGLSIIRATSKGRSTGLSRASVARSAFLCRSKMK